MKSKKCVQGTKHTSFHKELFKIKGHYSDVHKTNFFRSYVPTQMKNTATGLAIHSNERVYTVDSGASLHTKGLSSLNEKGKKTIRQSSKILNIQTACGVVVSDTQAKVFIKELGACMWVHLVRDSPSVLSLGRQ